MVNSSWFVVRRGGGWGKMEFFSCECYDRAVPLQSAWLGADSLAGKATVNPAASCIRLRIELSGVQCVYCGENILRIDWELQR